MADRVIVLGKTGTIVQQGTFEQLHDIEGYIRESCSNDIKSQEKIDEIEKLTACETVLSSKKECLPQELIQQSPRNGTGFAVYRFYFSSIGIWSLVVFLGTMIPFSFFFVFPSKCQILNVSSFYLFISQQSGWNFGPKATPAK